jgi:hypothetical protein
MQAFKKWRSNKEIHKLWKDYKKVAHLEYDNYQHLTHLRNDPKTLEKFELFINKIYEYTLSSTKSATYINEIENILGESTEVLKGIRQFLNW